MINTIIELITYDKNYSMQNCIVDYVKQNNKNYLIHFKEKTNDYIMGKQYFYLVDKSTHKYKMLPIPNEKSFTILDEFEDIKVIDLSRYN